MAAPPLPSDSLAPSSLSLDAVLFLQQWSPHPWLDAFALGITLLGDPKIIFLYVFPLVCWFSQQRATAMELLLALLTADWFNAMLKWPVRGDRPYWHDPRVREFWLTCESGWGMPSGHCMVTASALTIMVAHTPSRWRRHATVAAVLFLTLIALSRMYVGAHFPGQVIVGAVVGTMTAVIIHRSQISHRIHDSLQTLYSRSIASSDQRGSAPPSLYLRRVLFVTLLISLSLILVAVLEFLFLSLFSDPLHSITLAKNGCEATSSKPVSSSPSPGSAEESVAFQAERSAFMGVVRDAGVALGAGVGWALAVKEDKKGGGGDGSSATTTPLHTLLTAAVGLLLTHTVQTLLHFLFTSPPLTLIGAVVSLSLYTYFSNYALFGSLTLTILVLVPVCLKRLRVSAASMHRS